MTFDDFLTYLEDFASNRGLILDDFTDSQLAALATIAPRIAEAAAAEQERRKDPA